MRFVLQLVLYTGLAIGANAVVAAPADLAPHLAGDMEKMVLGEAPQPLPKAEFIDENDAPQTLQLYQGRVMLINFWATWCAPCRKELGALDRLASAMPEDRFAVVTIATGPNPLPAIQKLFTEVGVTRLPILRDPDQTFARAMGVLALPVSVLVDADGNEIGRLMGDAEWDGPEAKALIEAAIAAGG